MPPKTPFAQSPTVPAHTWYESWDSLAGLKSRWSTPASTQVLLNPAGQSKHIVDLREQSDALISDQRWDCTKPIVLTCFFRGQPLIGTKYWCGMCLYNRDGLDNNYVQIAAQRAVPPFHDNPNCNVISLTDDVGFICKGDPNPWRWHHGEIRYTPSLTGYFCDGQLFNVVEDKPLRDHPCIWLGDVSVGSGQANDGSLAQAQFGIVECRGTLVNA